MPEQNYLPVTSLLSVPESTESSLDENFLAQAPISKVSTESDGSIGSHLLFGLGTLLFVLPMLLPGISMNWLAILYGGLMVVGVAGFTLWGVVRSLKTRWQRRR